MFSELSSSWASKITPKGKNRGRLFLHVFLKLKNLFSGKMKENSRDRFEFSKDISCE